MWLSKASELLDLGWSNALLADLGTLLWQLSRHAHGLNSQDWENNAAIGYFWWPSLHLLTSQCLVTGTNEDISYIHMRMAESFCYFSCHLEASYYLLPTMSHPPMSWSLGFVFFTLPYMKLICPFVKSPLEPRFLEVRDSISSVFLEIIFVSITYCSSS